MFFKNSRLKNLIQLSRKAYGNYKKQIFVLIGLGFLNGVLGGIGVNAVIPLLSFASGAQVQELDFISNLIRRFFAFLHLDFSLKYLLIFICVLFALKSIVLVISSYIRVKITAAYEQETRDTLFRKTLNADWPYLLNQKVGYLSTVLMRDISQGASLLDRISTMMMTLTSLLVYIIIALNISLNITLFTIALGAMLFLFLKPLVYKTRVFARDRAAIGREVTHYVNESIIGMKAVKAMSAEKSVSGKSMGYFDKLKHLTIKALLMKEITGALLQPLSLVFISIIFAFSYKLPNFNIASFVVIVYLVERIFVYFQSCQGALHCVSEGLPYIKAAIDYKDDALNNQEKNNGFEPFRFQQALEFKNVCFGYDLNKPIFEALSFKIKNGEMIGLIGPSGAGKTTIVDLLLRLLTPQKGEILLDNKNINSIELKNWRKSFGYVAQDIFLLNDTVENNIKFYIDDISKKDIISAAKMANIYDFIQELPGQFSANVGERGISLSVGQRQRIVLARALAMKPEILVLDEATSALDNESEVFVQRAIKKLKGRITILIIAHRLSTLFDCDKLLILEKGAIREQGSSKELLKDKNSYFYKMHNIRQ